MWRQAILVFLCLVFLCTTGYKATYAAESQPKPKTSADFSDLKDMDAAIKVKIDSWLAKGYIEGISEDQFGVNEPISRAEFAKIIALSLRLKIDPT